MRKQSLINNNFNERQLNQYNNGSKKFQFG
jgi:hypothetical protein